MRVVTIRSYSYDVKAAEVICFSPTQGSGISGEKHPLNLIRVMPA